MAEVPITFAEVPVVRTAEQLEKAAGQLATSAYACVLRLDDQCLGGLGDTSWLRQYEDYSERQQEGLLTLRVLEHFLITANDPAMSWTFAGTFSGSSRPSTDHMLHTDPSMPGVVNINYHDTNPESGVEITFAHPTPAYDGATHSHLVTELLRRDMTNPRLVDPASFRRVRFESGGKVAFTTGVSGTQLQLHDFRTLTPTRRSLVWFLEGYAADAPEGEEPGGL